MYGVTLAWLLTQPGQWLYGMGGNKTQHFKITNSKTIFMLPDILKSPKSVREDL